jgi:ketosteroid isomerase-like protein
MRPETNLVSVPEITEKESTMSITMVRMEGILESFNSHDVECIVANFDENGEFLMAAGPEPYGERFVGRKAIGEAFRQRFSAIPDIRWVDAQTWISDDRAVTEWRAQGTTANGRLDCLGCDLWEFRNGKVLKKDTYYRQVTSS